MPDSPKLHQAQVWARDLWIYIGKTAESDKYAVDGCMTPAQMRELADILDPPNPAASLPNAASFPNAVLAPNGSHKLYRVEPGVPVRQMPKPDMPRTYDDQYGVERFTDTGERTK